MAGHDEEIAILGAMSWFRASSVSDLREVAKHACRLRFAPGSVLAREGTAALDFIVVISGSAALSRQGRPDRVIGPGGHTCDLDVLTRSQHRHTVVALTCVDIIVIDRRSLYGLLDEIPGLASRVATDLAQRLLRCEMNE